MPGPFAPAVGQRFAGRFELRTLLRGSGPARVFLAGDGPGAPVSLVLLDPAACHPTAWAQLARVTAAATERALPGLVPLRGVAPAAPDPPLCFADPPIGWSFDRLRQDGPPAWHRQDAPLWDRALRLGERAAALLMEVHGALGIPYRALLPQRLILTEADQILLLDIGVGELEPPLGRYDDCGYRAPEQVESRGDVASDVYSLAAILFELIAGERPSPRTPSRLRSLVPRVPQAIDDLFAEALAHDPARRYADMDDLRTAIRDALGLGPAPAPDVASAPAARAELAAQPQVAPQRSDLPVLPGSSAAPAPASATTASSSHPAPQVRVTAGASVGSAKAEKNAAPRPQGSAGRQAGGANGGPQMFGGGTARTGAAATQPPAPSSVGKPAPSPVSLFKPRTPTPLGPQHATRPERAPLPVLDDERTEVLKRAPRAEAVGRTEVLGPSPRVVAVERTEVLAPPESPTGLQPLPKPHAASHLGTGTMTGDDVTIEFTRAPARPADADRTVLELRHLSRVLHADTTLDLSPLLGPQSPAALVDPHPEKPPADEPAAPSRPSTARWTPQRLLVAINAVLLAATLIGLLALRC